MPHLILEHSAELSRQRDMNALAKALFEAALESGVFGAGKDIKTRTIACDNVFSGAEPQTFAHLTLRLVAGRPLEVRQKLANDLLAVLEAHLPEVGTLTVLPIEIDQDVYAKRVL
ncbi:5-carboxymethyl-2-hydroxymuconate Delta-isomerase [Cognatishimia sp. WU-CL00825]|uniref:5-carboxymethyl-2-hydroxymuconate Delta-isomerase n=1 Tax=Cognatishimia sp. WU-CL00825 TaxID=3127658 RepID=UPI0031080174